MCCLLFSSPVVFIFIDGFFLLRYVLSFSIVAGEIPITLTDSDRKKSRGVVRVLYNSTWSHICDRYYGGSEWGIDEATVACRQLGYKAPSNKYKPYRGWDYTDYYTYDDEPVLVTSVRCVGTEANLAQCKWTTEYDLLNVYCHKQVTLSCDDGSGEFNFCLSF